MDKHNPSYAITKTGELQAKCSKCGVESYTDKESVKAAVGEYISSEKENISVETPPEDYSKLLRTPYNDKTCEICDRDIPDYVQYVEKNDDTICSRCIKKIAAKIEEDKIKKWEKNVITPNAL